MTSLKSSGLGWADKIPAHWDVAKVCLVARLESGHTPSRLHPEYWVPSECTIPWFSLGDVWQLREGVREYIGETKEKISPRGMANSAARLLPAGTVVLSRTASVGFTGIMPEPMATTQDFANWICGPRLEPDFLLYAFRGMADEFQRMMMGSTHQTIYMPDIRRLSIPVPPRAEQSRIVRLLRQRLPKLDSLIAKKERLIELLQEKRQALITQAVTKGLDPNVPMKESGIEWLGPIPSNWILRRLKHLGQIRSGIAKGRDLAGKATVPRPYLRVANVQNGWLDLEDVATIEVTQDEARRYALRSGDVLMNEGGDFDKLGRGYVWEGQIAECIHQNHVFAVRPWRGVNPYWINLATQASYLRHFFILRSKQSTNLASISSTNLGEAPIPMPPNAEVEAILLRLRGRLGGLDSLARVVRTHIEKLREYRQALITAAVTGKIDVSRDAA